MSTQLPQQRLTVPGEVDEREFYTTKEGDETLVTHADLEQAVSNEEKPHLREINRYWVNKPYAFVVVYENVRENELRYIVVEPRLSELERELVNFFRDKIQTSINYDEVKTDATPKQRANTVRNETISLMKRYNLIGTEADIAPSSLAGVAKRTAIKFVQNLVERYGIDEEVEDEAPIPRDPNTGESQKLNSIQVRRVVYYLVRDFIRSDRIDAITNDVNVEDISCNGYNAPVFVYHTGYGQQIITNVSFGTRDLDNFVKQLAQRAGKGISRRQPNIDITLPNGSRAQLTLGKEISDQGTNFTIRQFNDIPFTPVDLINWRTFNIDQMAYMWMAIEHGKSIIFAGGTASGKTTSLNAMSLFMPSDHKVVSIEDTRELEIPHSNWVANITREAFQEGGVGDIDEFDLLEDALRKRPDYVIMGEVRGEEGRTLFQIMNTGHVTYTTFHADSVGEVIKRFTTDPINVAPSMFDSLDVISVQSNVDIKGTEVRRNKMIVELDTYNATNGQFTMNDAFTWETETDTFRPKEWENILDTRVLNEIQQERGWNDKELRREWNRRRLVLAYLVDHSINTYAGVATTLQAYMSSKDTVLGLIGDDRLESRIAALHKMRTINIETDPEKEALIPRPTTPKEVESQAKSILDETEPLLVGYDSRDVDFAGTVRDLLGEDELPGSGVVDEFEEIVDEETEALPGDEAEGTFPTSSEEFEANPESEYDLEEGLEYVFDDLEESDQKQMVLTSETLNQIHSEQQQSTDEEPEEVIETIEADEPDEVETEEIDTPEPETDTGVDGDTDTQDGFNFDDVDIEEEIEKMEDVDDMDISADDILDDLDEQKDEPETDDTDYNEEVRDDGTRVVELPDDEQETDGTDETDETEGEDTETGSEDLDGDEE